MTIILSTKRDPFAVLAADRRNNCGASFFDHEKYARHPSLPLAFAISGLMNFSRSINDRHPADAIHHLAQFAATITSESELVVAEISCRLVDYFQGAMNFNRDIITVFIALVRDGKADTGAQVVNDVNAAENHTAPHGSCYFVAPDKTRDEYLLQEGRLDRLHLHQGNQNEVVEIARGLIRRGLIRGAIEYEQQSHNGTNITIGGEPDVILVTARGARLVPQP